MHVLTRSSAARELALSLGCASAGDAADAPPEPLDAAILFAPVGDLVPVALSALDRGGTLAVAGIYLSEIPPLDYERHLFYERVLRSVTANTRGDGREFLEAAARVGRHGHGPAVPVRARRTLALADLAQRPGQRGRGARGLPALGAVTRRLSFRPGVSEWAMAMREECKHFQSRTYSSGEVARFCVLGNAPDQPWSCPENCVTYERRLADVGWVARHPGAEAGRDDRPRRRCPSRTGASCSTRRATSSTPWRPS